nr:NifB/NifX family molybdenum-iron cluster-binding protein [Geotalea toluenoxydans]
MEIRVAVASSNGATVNEHFGRAKNFTIYRLVEEIWQHVEERPNLLPAMDTVTATPCWSKPLPCSGTARESSSTRSVPEPWIPCCIAISCPLP